MADETTTEGGAAPGQAVAQGEENPRGMRKERVGVVVSNAMNKTITVAVQGVVSHGLYKKPMKRTKKFKAHDENDTAQVGDLVRIRETRPLSKTKRWRLTEVIKRAD
jgi:small subunit ribosomal protein S17